MAMDTGHAGVDADEVVGAGCMKSAVNVVTACKRRGNITGDNRIVHPVVCRSRRHAKAAAEVGRVVRDRRVDDAERRRIADKIDGTTLIRRNLTACRFRTVARNRRVDNRDGRVGVDEQAAALGVRDIARHKRRRQGQRASCKIHPAAIHHRRVAGNRRAGDRNVVGLPCESTGRHFHGKDTAAVRTGLVAANHAAGHRRRTRRIQINPAAVSRRGCVAGNLRVDDRYVFIKVQGCAAAISPRRVAANHGIANGQIARNGRKNAGRSTTGRQPAAVSGSTVRVSHVKTSGNGGETFKKRQRKRVMIEFYQFFQSMSI